MNKRLFILICSLIIQFLIFSDFTFAKEDIERIKDFINTPPDFNIKVEVKGKEEQDPIVVDGATTFVISGTDVTSRTDTYKLYYFFEGGIRRIIDDVLLPYEFKQTYRGLIEGSYVLSFVLKDAQGKYGSCTLPIHVEYK